MKCQCLFLFLLFLPLFLFSQTPEDFRYSKQVTGFKDNTLFRLIKENEDGTVTVALYHLKQTNGQRFRMKQSEAILPKIFWDQLSSPQFKIDQKTGQLLLQHPNKKVMEFVFEEENKPFICAPEQKNNVQQSTNEILKKAETTLATSPSSVKELEDQIKSDFEALNQKLNLATKYNMDYFYKTYFDADAQLRKAEAQLNKLKKSKETLKLTEAKAKVVEARKVYEEAKDDMINTLENAKSDFLRILSKEIEETSRASRLLVALTLFGEFRGHSNPAHLYGAMKTMENRAKDNRFKNRRTVQLPNGTKWLDGFPGGAALARAQYSTWNVTEITNLFSVLTLRDPTSNQIAIESKKQAGKKAWEDIVHFVAEKEAGLWEPVEKNPPEIDHYDSPRSSPDKLNFRPVPLPAIKHKVTGEVSTVDPEVIRGGFGIWK